MLPIRITGGHTGPLFKNRSQVRGGQSRPVMQRRGSLNWFDDLSSKNARKDVKVNYYMLPLKISIGRTSKFISGGDADRWAEALERFQHITRLVGSPSVKIGRFSIYFLLLSLKLTVMVWNARYLDILMSDDNRISIIYYTVGTRWIQLNNIPLTFQDDASHLGC